VILFNPPPRFLANQLFQSLNGQGRVADFQISLNTPRTPMMEGATLCESLQIGSKAQSPQVFRGKSSILQTDGVIVGFSSTSTVKVGRSPDYAAFVPDFTFFSNFQTLLEKKESK
jgi:hypothetical protein